MKKNKSLIFKIQVLTALLSLLMLIVLAAVFLVVYFNEKRDESKKAIHIYTTQAHQKSYASSLGYEELLDKEEIAALGKEGKNLLLDEDMIKSFASGNIVMLTYKNHYYFHFKPSNLYLKSTYETSSVLLYVMLFFVIIGLFFYLLLRYIKASIYPLKHLHQQIQKFGKGDLSVDTRSNNEDEVAQVGNAFYAALQSIQALESNRALFMKNISHELKTPLTKNTLILHALKTNDDEVKEDLLRHNAQMNSIIDSMSQFDSLQSSHLHLNTAMFNLIDIVDEALEQSAIPETSIDFNLKETSKQDVDFERLVLVVKNLLLNAYTHSHEGKVSIVLEENFLSVSNHAITPKALDFEKITQAFYKEDVSSKGMGLGVYIVQRIVQMHHFSLRYHYDDAKQSHQFMIVFE